MIMRYGINRFNINLHFLKNFVLLKIYLDYYKKLKNTERNYNFDIKGKRDEVDDIEGDKLSSSKNNQFICPEVLLHFGEFVCDYIDLHIPFTYNYENLSGNNILRQNITYPGQQQQKVVERTFDILNRISEIKEGSSTIASMTHIGKSFRLSKKQYGNGDTINFLYDRGRRMSDLEVSDKNSNIILKYAFGYNNVNMKTADQRGHDNNKGDLFEYDSVYRLTRQMFKVLEPLANKDVGNSYTLKDFSDPNEPIQFEKEKIIEFDKLYNIKRLKTTMGTETTEIISTIEDNNEKLNQYTTFDQWGLDYDANGNTTQKGTQFFTYDYRNQLVSVTDSSDNSTVNYKYDALGRQIEKTLATGPGPLTTKYFYSGNQVIEERDGSDNILKQYIYGNGIDEIIRMDRNENGTMVPYYFHTNSIGSIVAISDQDGQLVERISYDIYGMPTFTDYKTDPQNPTVVENSVIGNDILFQGRRYDKETNLYYYRARYFDPIMGRFLQTDPMGYEDSMNLYQAFNQNPVNFVDPFGFETYSEFVKKTRDTWYEIYELQKEGSLDTNYTKVQIEEIIAKEIADWKEYHTEEINTEKIEESGFWKDFWSGVKNQISSIYNKPENIANDVRKRGAEKAQRKRESYSPEVYSAASEAIEYKIAITTTGPTEVAATAIEEGGGYLRDTAIIGALNKTLKVVKSAKGVKGNFTNNRYTFRIDTKSISTKEGGFHIHIFDKGSEIVKVTGKGKFLEMHKGKHLMKPSQINKDLRKEINSLIRYVQKMLK